MTPPADRRSDQGGPPATDLGRELLLFRLGRELFAVDLCASEEALELPALERLPAMGGALLGAHLSRGQLVPVYAADRVLGTPSANGHAVLLVLRTRDGRIGLAIDDVEDVIMPDRSTMRPPPAADPDRVLRGVVHHGPELVSLIDVNALAHACAAASPSSVPGGPS